jgi:competence protein ComGC
MITFRKNSGYSIVEMLVAISILIFITLGYIKHKSDLKIYEREQHLYNEIKLNSLSFQKYILNRVLNNEEINIFQANEYFKNFTYENCFDDTTGVQKEFQLGFCHVINKNRNAQFNIYECSNDNVCFTYRPNRLLINNKEMCDDKELCMEQVFWGLKISNSLITISGVN